MEKNKLGANGSLTKCTRLKQNQDRRSTQLLSRYLKGSSVLHAISSRSSLSNVMWILRTCQFTWSKASKTSTLRRLLDPFLLLELHQYICSPPDNEEKKNRPVMMRDSELAHRNVKSGRGPRECLSSGSHGGASCWWLRGRLRNVSLYACESRLIASRHVAHKAPYQ